MTAEQIDLFSNHTYERADALPTSSAASRAALGKSGTKRYLVALALSRRAMSDSQLQECLGMSGNSLRPRRKELCDFGYTEDSGRRVVNGYGNPEILWRLTEAGRKALEQAA